VGYDSPKKPITDAQLNSNLLLDLGYAKYHAAAIANKDVQK
jgi:hypothetical protein